MKKTLKKIIAASAILLLSTAMECGDNIYLVEVDDPAPEPEPEPEPDTIIIYCVKWAPILCEPGVSVPPPKCLEWSE